MYIYRWYLSISLPSRPTYPPIYPIYLNSLNSHDSSGTSTVAPFVQTIQQVTVQVLLECHNVRAVSPRERCGHTNKNITHGKSMGPTLACPALQSSTVLHQMVFVSRAFRDGKGHKPKQNICAASGCCCMLVARWFWALVMFWIHIAQASTASGWEQRPARWHWRPPNSDHSWSVGSEPKNTCHLSDIIFGISMTKCMHSWLYINLRKCKDMPSK